ncbi:MAG: hypothetical protein U0X73_03945 [Thermoanaerobaculia bacterium]
MRAGRVAAVLALAALLLAGRAAAAEYEDAFKQGVSALDQKKWGVTVAAMRAAIAANPREGGKRIRVYGTWFLDYLPYYYLGLALAQQGDTAGAAEAWRESLRQGAIQKTALATDLERRMRQLPGAAASSPPPAVEPPAVRPEAVETAPAGTSVAAVPKAPAASPRTEPAGAPSVAVAAPNVAPANAVPAADPLARQLALAARSYFAGRYAEARSRLAALVWSQGPPARACVLEAAAAFAEYREGGERDPDLLGRARTALGRCAGDRGLEAAADARLFSPPFVRFVANVASR